MNNNSDISLLLFKIIDKTLDGRVEWVKGVYFNSFVYNMSEASISLTLSPGENNDSYVFFNILDGTGLVIESIGESFSWSPTRDSTPISYLYYIAKRKALKVDEAVHNITRYIDSL
ncbi:hypothetical protein JMF94_12985 [Desulfovibrio sp. UIB00]|uniref:hypothetical protein n=1 Tax=Desulfovibrio sp. UIB00 TaxID=2804314 RepID=UPI001F0E6DD9|nr:hypothetical protein [Desulfovibrio sp. UIB00]MCH5145998.1 hypothetical protein [Desulfovibrio sp. UIB00]